MSRKFKVGDKVKLNRNKVSREELYEQASSGQFGKIYVIERIEDRDYMDILLEDSNWHSSSWLDSVVKDNEIGGKLI